MKSIQKEFRFLALLLVCASMIGMSGFWVWDDYNELQEGLQELQTRYMTEHRQVLEEKISNVITFIDYKKGHIQQYLRDTVKQRTYDAIAIAENIVAENSGKLDDATLRKVVKDALRNIRYNNGRGYYFAINMNGIEELFADKPELEGRDLRSMLDNDGRPVIVDMLRIGREENEGFYSYTWTKPDSPDNSYVKIAFVKYFEPFDWVIGTGEYIDDVTADVQKEITDRIEKIRFGSDNRNYVFVGSYEGVSLTLPAKGKNMYDVQDLNGKYIVRELIRMAQGGSGFVEYVMPGIEGKRPSLKLSYSAGVDDWQWYVGAGIYIDELEMLIASRKKEFSDKTRKQFIVLLLMSCGLLFFLYLLSTLLSRGIGRNIEVFSSFFRKAATESVDIDVDSLRYSEFKDIANGANRMLTERNRVLQKVRDARDEWAGT
ncbi:MAG: cache domain-containing protein, partial [Desulfobulbaceae bacterium]|nr:cache domain-containing protein [Desulfobulbaceae bacterium]